MNGLLWVASVVTGALGILSLVTGHLIQGLALLVLTTALGLVAAAGSTNLE